jgi:hypothetical protein
MKIIQNLVLLPLALTVSLMMDGSELLRCAGIHVPIASADPPQRASFVPCESDGMLGPSPAPKDRVQSPTLPQALARSLAYYASAGLGVLAPRGWYCFELYGSSGLTLIVTPERHDARDLFRPDSHLTGPVIQLSFFFGDTSGRFLVAQVAARLFPVKKSFVQQIIDEGIEPPSDFPSGPYPDDVIQRRSETEVEFETPAGKDGMGTEKSRLTKQDAPISGVAIVTTGNDLVLLDVRMPPDLRNLASVIIKNTREQSGLFPFRSGGQ